MKKYTRLKKYRFLFYITYALNLIFLLDSLLTESIFNMNRYYSYLYLVFWGATILVYNGFKIRIGRPQLSKNLTILLLLYYVFFGMYSVTTPMAYAAVPELMGCIRYVLTIAINIFAIKQFKIWNQFVNLTFTICALFCIICYIRAGMPLNALYNIQHIMSTEGRFREGFGLYNVNAMGNLSAFTLILSALSLYSARKGTHVGFTKKCVIFIADIIVVLVLLSTASRNSVLEAVLFVVMLLFLNITSSKKTSKGLVVVMRLLMILFGGFFVLFTQIDNISGLFESSLRANMFNVNLPLFFNSKRELFGLGLFNSGLFSGSQTAYGTSVNVDSYYLYVLMETGVVGLFIIGFVLISIGKQLLIIDRQNPSVISRIMIALFVAILFSGVAETTVIYYVFPSSMMALSLLLAYISDAKSLIKRGEKNAHLRV